MKIPMFTAAILVAAACPVHAQKAELSQHPRSGQLAVIDFARASSELAPDLELKLGQIAGWAQEHPDGLIVLDGYPDRADDTQLAVRRVETVRDTLIGAGVDPDQLVVSAFDAPAGPRVIVSGTHQTIAEVIATHGQAAMVAWGQREANPPQVAGR